MSKAERIRHQRAAVPPPVGKRQPISQRLVWLCTGSVALVIAIVVVILLATRSTPKVAAPASSSASDVGAPASLVAAANAVGFHPTTEPGVGEIESKPLSAANPPANPNLLPVGAKAPPFALKTPEGEQVSLASDRGNAVLLEFFATWCPHCNAEAPHIAALSRSLQDEHIRVLSVNADGETAPSVFAFHRYYGLPYPALLDPSSQPGSFTHEGAAGAVSTTYKVADFPTFYVIAPNGVIAWHGDGEQPDVLLRRELVTAGRT
jgi:peroxiredoxin